MALSIMLNLFHSQFLTTPPYPTASFASKVAIVTGSNTGLGLEAARHIVRLDAEKVILAVRDQSKGEAAKRSIEETTQRRDVVEVWALDLSSYESVKQFAMKAQALKRLDVLLQNAGMMARSFKITEQDESTITTNVTSTFLLALLMLPKLRETAQKFNSVPRLTIVTSDVHFITQFKERRAERIFDELNNEKTANMDDRYGVSKLLEILLVRAMSDSISLSSKPPVIANCLTPGVCKSDFFRESKGIGRLFVELVYLLVARTTEVGSRTLVAGASGGEETHGKYMDSSTIATESQFVRSAEGAEIQAKVWQELGEKLERIQPGIMGNL